MEPRAGSQFQPMARGFVRPLGLLHLLLALLQAGTQSHTCACVCVCVCNPAARRLPPTPRGSLIDYKRLLCVCMYACSWVCGCNGGICPASNLRLSPQHSLVPSGEGCRSNWRCEDCGSAARGWESAHSLASGPSSQPSALPLPTASLPPSRSRRRLAFASSA